MLSKREIIEINNKMTDRGEPVEKDNNGYNKNHYYRCAFMSCLPEEDFSDIMIYTILDTLMFYSNTQLKDYKDELRETRKHYKTLIDEEELRAYKIDKSFAKKKYKYMQLSEAERKREDRERIEKEKKEALEKKLKEEGVKVSNPNINGIELYWEPRCKNADKLINELKINKKAEWQKKDDEWWLVINWDSLSDLINILIENGYKTDRAEEEYKKYLDGEYKGILFGINIEQKEEDSIIISFEGKLNELSDFVRKEKPKIKWIKNENNWNLEVKNEFIEKAADFFSKYNYNTNVLYEYKEECDNKINRQLEAEKIRIAEVENIEISKYDLPFEPYEHQLYAVKQLLISKKKIVGDEMGVGKTLIAILTSLTIEKLSENINKDVKTLIICPESLRLNWVKEIKMVDNNADISLLYKKNEYKSARWIICAYGTVDKFVKNIKEDNIKVCILDEAHFCKSINNYGLPTTKRGEAVNEIVESGIEYIYPMTGTPIPTSNKDIYPLLKMVDAFETDYTFFNFGVDYCDGEYNGYGWNFKGNSNSDKLNLVLAEYMIRRTKAEVLPYLKKNRNYIPVEVPKEKFEKATIKARETFENNKDYDSFLGYTMMARRILSSYKVKIAIDLAKNFLEEGESVVIVSSFRDTVDKIKKEFGDNCCIIEGGMKDKEKHKSVNDFQDGKCSVCAMNIIAGGVGLTLTKASRMIICDFDWTPGNMIQAEDRICRAGQEKFCNIFYLYAEGIDIDEYFVEMFKDKYLNSNIVSDGNDSELSFVKKMMNKLINSES